MMLTKYRYGIILISLNLDARTRGPTVVVGLASYYLPRHFTPYHAFDHLVFTTFLCLMHSVNVTSR